MKQSRARRAKPAAVAAEPRAPAPAWPVWVALGAVLGLAVILGCREIASPDVGFHLNSGRWTAEHGAPPQVETFVTAALGKPYIDLQWLYQLGLWQGYRLGGPFALVAGNVALSLLSFGLLVLRVRRREGRVPLGTALLLLGFALGSEWELRPHVLSWVWLNLVLLILEEDDRKRTRLVFMLPVLLLLWANCHSLYILGLVAIGCHGVGRGWQLVASGGWRDFGRFALVAVLSGLACLVTPYGWQGVRFPFEQLAQLDADAVFKSSASGIAEFLSPLSSTGYLYNGRLVLFRPLLFVQAMLVLVLLGHLALVRRTSIAEWLRLLLFGYVFVLAQKNFGYFVVATLPVAASGLSAGVAWVVAGWRTATANRFRTLLTGSLVLFCVAFAGWVLTGGWYRAGWSVHRVGFGFNERAVPVVAARFLAAAPPAARVLNSFDDGGWLAFATRGEVFIDGRTEVNGPEHYRRYLDFTNPDTMPDEISALQPDAVLVPLGNIPQWHDYLAQSRRWRLVYADEWSAVYFHPDYAAGVPRLPPPVAGPDYPPMDDKDLDRILAEGSRRSHAGWPGAWKGAGAYPMAALRRSAFYLMGREPLAARNWALRGIAECDVFFGDVWVNLAYALADLGDHERAGRCIEALRRGAPGNETENLARELEQIRRQPRNLEISNRASRN